MTTFSARPYELNGHTIIRLPRDVSAAFPSRSQLYVRGTMSGIAFDSALEPDGAGSHWIDVPHALAQDAHLTPETDAHVSIELTNEWPEPHMPQAFLDMLAAYPDAKATYDKATTMAHWEWYRWTVATKNPETFKKHIDVSRSKLAKGMRRPCCFNRASCTAADVAKSGVLIDPR